MTRSVTFSLILAVLFTIGSAHSATADTTLFVRVGVNQHEFRLENVGNDTIAALHGRFSTVPSWVRPATVSDAVVVPLDRGIARPSINASFEILSESTEGENGEIGIEFYELDPAGTEINVRRARYRVVVDDQGPAASQPFPEEGAVVDDPTFGFHVLSNPAPVAMGSLRFSINGVEYGYEPAAIRYDAAAGTVTIKPWLLSEPPILRTGEQLAVVLLRLDDAGGNPLSTPLAFTFSLDYHDDQTPPESPRFTSGKARSSHVELAWVPNLEPDLAGYILYRLTSTASESEIVATLDSVTTEYLDTGLAGGWTYTYYLVATDSAGNRSIPSEPLPLTPSAPVMVTFEVVAPDAITSMALDIMEGDAPIAQVTMSLLSPGQFEVAETLDPSRPLVYRYVAFPEFDTRLLEPVLETSSGYREVDLTRQVGETVHLMDAFAVQPLPAPSGLTATPESGAVRLAWNYQTGAVGARLSFATSSGGPFVSSGETLIYGTSSVVSALTNGETYFFKLSWVDRYGQEGRPTALLAAVPRRLVPVTFVVDVASSGETSISSVTVIGSPAPLTTNPLPNALSNALGTVWTRTVSIPEGTALRYRYIVNNRISERVFPTASSDREVVVVADASGRLILSDIFFGAGVEPGVPFVFLRPDRPIMRRPDGALVTDSGPSYSLMAADLDGVITRIEYAVDGGQFAEFTGAPFRLLSAGNHVVAYRAFDDSGLSSNVETIEILVDLEPPAISVSSPEDRIYSPDDAIVLGFSAVDAGAGVGDLRALIAGRLDRVLRSGQLLSLSDFSVGHHALTIRATDALGHRSEVQAPFRIGLVVNPISARPDIYSPDTWSSARFVFSTSAAASVGVRIRNESGADVRLLGPSQPVRGPQEFSWDGRDASGAVVPDGVYTATASPSDATIPYESTGTLAIRVDRTPPALTMSTPQPGLFVGEILSVFGTITDLHLSSWQLYRDYLGDAAGPVKLAEDTMARLSGPLVTLAVSGLQEGAHRFILEAADVCGNRTVVTSDIVLDKSAPVVRVTEPLPGSRYLVGRDIVIYSLEIRDAIDSEITTSFEWRRDSDGAVRAAGASGEEPAIAFGVGHWRLNATAVDRSGNRAGDSSLVVVIEGDATSPDITLALPSGDTINHSTGGTLAFSVADSQIGLAPATLSVSWNGSPLPVDTSAMSAGALFASFSYPVLSVETLRAGDRPELRIEVADRAGNRTVRARSFFVRDDVPPTSRLLIDQPAISSGNDSFVSATTSLRIVSVDTAGEVARREWSGNGSSFINAGESFTLSAFADGPVTLAYRAVDASGNVEASRSARLVKDATGPNATLRIEGLVVERNGDLIVAPSSRIALDSTDGLGVGVGHLSYAIDTSSSVSYATPFSLVVEGAHTVKFSGVDRLGNAGAEFTRSLSVDSTPPVSVVTVGSPSWTSIVPFDRSGVFSGVAFDSIQAAGVLEMVNVLSLRVLDDEILLAADEARNIVAARGVISETVSTGPILSLTQLDAVAQIGASALRALRDSVPIYLTYLKSGGDISSQVTFTAAQVAKTLGFANTATSAQLQSVSGIGSATATAIINGRPYVDIPSLDAIVTVTVLRNLRNHNSTATDADTTVSRRVVDGAVHVAPHAVLTVTATDTAAGVAAIRTALDGTSTDSLAVRSGLAEGVHVLRYRSEDAIGNRERPRAFVVASDSTPPEITLSVGSPSVDAGGSLGTVVRSTTFLTATAVDPIIASAPSGGVAGLSAVPGAGIGAFTRTIYVGELAETTLPVAGAFTLAGSGGSGSRSLRLGAADRVGNASLLERAFTVDDDPPVVGIAAPTAGRIYIQARDSISIELSVSDLDPMPSARAYLRSTAGSTVAVTAPALLEPGALTPGFWSLVVEAEDWVGNKVFAETGPFEVVHDVLAPRTSLAIGPPVAEGLFTGAAPGETFVTSLSVFTLAAVDDLVSAGDDAGLGITRTEYGIDTEALTAGDFFQLSGPDGPRVIRFRSIDVVGNEEAPNRLTIDLDNTPPSVSAEVGVPRYEDDRSLFVTAATPVSFHIADAGVGVEAESVVTRHAVGEGAHVIDFAVADALGNRSETVAVAVTADNEPPVLFVSLGAPRADRDGVTYLSALSVIEASAVDATVGLASFDSPVLPLVAGAQVLEYRAVDLLGNTSETSIPVTVDTAAPVIIITSPTAGESYIGGRDTISVSFTVTDDHDATPTASAVLRNTTTSAEIAVTAGQDVAASELAAGTWELVVVASDFVANSSTLSSGAFTVTHDELAPRTTVTVGDPRYGDSPVFITSATPIRFQAVDDLVTVGDGVGLGVLRIEAAVDSGDFLAVTDSLFVRGADGQRTIRYRAVDILGNVEAERTLDVRLDNTTPVSRLTVSAPFYVSDHVLDRSAVVSGITFDAAQAAAVLEMTNLMSVRLLDDEAGLASDAVASIVAARPLLTLVALDDVPQVGSSTLQSLLNFVPLYVNYIRPGGDVTSGVAFTPSQVPTVLAFVNTATSAQLQSVSGIGATTASTIIAGRPYNDVVALDLRVTTTVLRNIRDHAAPSSTPTDSGIVEGVEFTPAEAEAVLLLVNTAPTETLTRVPSIDPVKAGNIMAARPILDLIALGNVPLIGPETLRNLKYFVGGASGITDGVAYVAFPTTLSVSAQDAGVGVGAIQTDLDGAGYQEIASRTALSEGLHALAYRAEDLLGNREGARAEIVVADSTAPILALAVGEPSADGGATLGTVVRTTTPIAVTAADPDLPGGPMGPVYSVSTFPGAGVRATTHDASGTFEPVSNPMLLPSFGTRLVRFRSEDQVGNAATTERRFTVDEEAPLVTITAPDSGRVYLARRDSIVIAFTVVDGIDPLPGVVAELVDEEEGTRVPVSSGDMIEPETIDAGFWRIEVTATDWVSNTNTVVSGRFEVVHDAAPPVVTATWSGTLHLDGMSRRYGAPGASLTLEAIDTGVGLAVFEAAVAVSDYEPVEEPFVFTAPGEHVVRWRASDFVGNLATGEERIRIDAAAPSIRVLVDITDTTGTVLIPESLVTIEAEDAGSVGGAASASGLAAITWRVDTGDPGAYTAPFEIDRIGFGPHAISARAVDHVGNAVETVIPFVLSPALEVTKTRTIAPRTLLWWNEAGLSAGASVGSARAEARAEMERLARARGVLLETVTSAAAFGTAMTSGRHNVFVIVGDREALEEPEERQLAERVNLGAGLVGIGYDRVRGPMLAHDNRAGLDALARNNVLGVKVAGRFPESGVTVLVSGGGVLETSVMLTAAERAMRVRAFVGETAAVYLLTDAPGLSGGSGGPGGGPGGSGGGRVGSGGRPSQDDETVTTVAGVLRTYGWGRSVYLGFDPVAALTASDSLETATRVLAGVLDAVRPETEPMIAGGVVAVRITVKSLVVPLDFTVSIEELLPSDVTLLAVSQPAILSGGAITWTVLLDAGEETTVRYVASLPYEEGATVTTARVTYLVRGRYRTFDDLPLEFRLPRMDRDLEEARTILERLVGRAPVVGGDRARLEEAVATVSDLLARPPGDAASRSLAVDDLMNAIQSITRVEQADLQAEIATARRLMGAVIMHYSAWGLE